MLIFNAIINEMVNSAKFLKYTHASVLAVLYFTMAMAFFVIHAGDTFAGRELPLIYLLVFIIMYIAGPGYFSLDTAMRRIYGLPTK